MYLESVRVSRKTPADGKLQITRSTFNALEGAAGGLTAKVRRAEAPCSLVTMECTCNKHHESGVAGTSAMPHRHYFLQCVLFHELMPDALLRLDLDGIRLQVAVTSVDATVP
jgi:hypothetical protein